MAEPDIDHAGDPPEAQEFVLPPPEPTIFTATDLGSATVLKHGNLYLLADPSGDIGPDDRGLGLYDLDTRVLSCAILRVNGVRPTLIRAEPGTGYATSLQLTSDGDGSPVSDPPLSITRRRWIAGGLAERIDVRNDGPSRQQVTIDLALDFDAADIFEVRGWTRDHRGELQPTTATADSIVFAYVGLDGLRRRTMVACSPASVSAIDGRRGGIPASVQARWVVDIEPGGHAEIKWDVTTDLTADVHPASLPAPIGTPADNAAEYAAWLTRWTRIESGDPGLDAVLERGMTDLRLLRNEGPLPGEQYLAAGVPWYTTLFGRDSIIAALEVLPFNPEVARQTLAVLARLQATDDDPERDMEPGKILHELRFGEMARTGEVPYRPYYGTVDATPLWLILLDEAHRWTGDLGLVRSLWPNALAALDWIDRFGDRDGDGFVEYERRASAGQLHQGWKDSTDPVRHRDGAVADAPIALVEVQGYVYDAKRRMASLADRLGDHEFAGRLRKQAATLRARFDAAFWMPDVGFYAIALDRDKRQVGTITSNPGHCLWSDIVPPARVDAVIEGLLGPAMDGGWGIRTFAASQPGYDPLGYHTGSVWPHDNALIAAGMRRAGRPDAAALVAGRMLEAARRSPGRRLPELFGGFARERDEAPVPYPVACSPQAWSAATAFSLLGTVLGLRADAASGLLEVEHPWLPDGLGGVLLRGVRVGAGEVDLAFHGSGGTTRVDVVRRDGPVEVAIRS